MNYLTRVNNVLYLSFVDNTAELINLILLKNLKPNLGKPKRLLSRDVAYVLKGKDGKTYNYDDSVISERRNFCAFCIMFSSW